MGSEATRALIKSLMEARDTATISDGEEDQPIVSVMLSINNVNALLNELGVRENMPEAPASEMPEAPASEMPEAPASEKPVDKKK